MTISHLSKSFFARVYQYCSQDLSIQAMLFTCDVALHWLDGQARSSCPGKTKFFGFRGPNQKFRTHEPNYRKSFPLRVYSVGFQVSEFEKLSAACAPSPSRPPERGPSTTKLSPIKNTTYREHSPSFTRPCQSQQKMAHTTTQVRFHESDLMTPCRRFRPTSRAASFSHLLSRDLLTNKDPLFSL